MTPYHFAQLLAWCSRDYDIPSPALCCPRLRGGVWAASDGKALAWRRAESPLDADPFLERDYPGLDHRIHDIEAYWPSADWCCLPVSCLSPIARQGCQACGGSGLSRSADGGAEMLGLWPCDACDGTGHVDGALVRLDCMPDTCAIAIDYLLRIGPLDRLAWTHNPIFRGGGANLLIGETPNGLRYAIMPIVLPPDRATTHVLCTVTPRSP